MTILWIYNLPLKPESGGTERLTSLVARGLSERGHRCLDILVFNEQTGAMTYRDTPVTDLYAFLKDLEVDVVINLIAQNTWLLDMFLKKGGSRWQKGGGKIISCLHFDPKSPHLLHLFRCKNSKNWRDYLNVVKTFLLYPYYRRRQERTEGDVYNFIYEHSDYMVALTPKHFPYLQKVMKRADYEKLVAINNPLTFEDISGPEILQEKKKVVLVCARMDEYYKRISLILKTWAYIQAHYPAASEWTLKIVGTGSDLEHYREYVKANHIPNILFEGQQSPEPYYREASLLLMTSSAEGWPMVMGECLQRAVIPVVMDSCPVFQEMIENGVNGFITPNNDVKAYARTLMKLMDDSQLRATMQLAALQSARAYTLESTIPKWEKKCHLTLNA